MTIDTIFFERCIATLDKALTLLQASDPDSIDHDMYHSACVKEFEIILEQTGKLLRKALKPFLHSSKAVDSLTFKEIFRHCVRHGIITDKNAIGGCNTGITVIIPRMTMELTLRKKHLRYYPGSVQMLPALLQPYKNKTTNADQGKRQTGFAEYICVCKCAL